MVSRKFKIIMSLSIFLFFIHDIEEIIMKFWTVGSVLTIWNEYITSISHAVFWTALIVFWLFLIPIYLLVLGGKWALRGLALFGLMFVFECHHLVNALFITQSYNPGLMTAVFFPSISFFYYRELIYNFRRLKNN